MVAKKEVETALQTAESKQKREIQEFDEARESNPWLRKVKWQAHTAGLDKEELPELVSSVGDDEPELQVLYKAFDWMIQGAQFTAVSEIVGETALFEVNKKEAKVETQMPFDSWMDITTVRSYTHVWRQILGYVFRTQDTPTDKRPPYKLTSNQIIYMQSLRRLIDRFQQWKTTHNPETHNGESQAESGTEEEDESDEEIEKMKEIEREVLRFCISLLDHPLQDNEYKSGIISALAVMGIRDDGGWLNAEDYTPKYSAVIKLARLMVVQEAYERKEEAIKQMQEGDTDITDEFARDNTRSYYHFIRQMVRKFMTITDGKRDPTPLQWIYRARSYGLKIRYTTTAEGCIQWIGETILYQQIRFDMAEVRTMMHGLVREAREVLFKELMFVDVDSKGHVDATQAPGIDWETMVDNPTENRVGWSFLDDERNRFPVDGKWWLYQRMFTEQRVRQRFITESSDQSIPQIRDEIVDQYERHVNEFREKLLLLFHLSGGQPGRSPELLGLRWKNSEQGGIRNIFIEDGLVAFVTGYHKGYRSSGNIKIIHRYLPREVGELFVYYVLVVSPFHEKLQVNRENGKRGSAFLWGHSQKIEHRRWTGPRRDRKEKNAEEDHLDQGWTSERMRRALQDASMRLIGVKIHISCWRNSAIAISRKFCREAPFSSEEDDAARNDPPDDDENDLQAGHGTHIAGMIYGRELTENRDAISSRRSKFRKISQVWHQFFNFTSSHDTTQPALKRKRNTVEDDMQDAQIARWKRLRTVDIQSELEIIVGKGAQFRGKQEEALRAIMANVSPVLVVMGTGAGKSLLFQLPAHSQKSGITVVVVPLKTLERNLHARCCKAGISSIMWDPNQPNRTAQIVFVQPESAVSTKFNQQLNRWEGLGQIDRFVIDECHTVRQSRPDFRPKMREAGAMLKERGKQMVFLTATLSPASEVEFFEIMQMPPVQPIRGPTTRPNIRYSVFEHRKETDQIDAVGEIIRQKLIQYPAPAKIIIYSSSIEMIEEMGVRLGYPMYYAGVGNEKQKAHIQQQWENATQRVAICSNAFGLGIDQPDVRFVGHVGPIYDIENYGQESGRAGRDGMPSEAMVIASPGQQQMLQQQHRQRQREPTRSTAIITDEDRDRVQRFKAERFVSGISCRRVWLDQELDGRTDRTGCEQGEEKCDVCAEDDKMVAEAEELRRMYIASQERHEQCQDDRALDSGIGMSSSAPQISASSNIPDHPPDHPSSYPSSPPNHPWNHPSNPPDHSPDHSPNHPSSSADQPLSHRASSPDHSFNVSNHPSDFPVHSSSQQSIVSPTDSPRDNPDPPRGVNSPDDRVSSCYSTPSVESFDAGFATDITPIDRIQFQSQQERHQVSREYTRTQNMGHHRDIRQLQERLEWWVGRCPLCVVLGYPDGQTQHPFRQCGRPDANSAREAWFQMSKSMRPAGPGKPGKFAPYSCCYGCFAPQAMCQKWQRQEEGRGRFKSTSRVCQFDDIIMPVVVCMFREGSSDAEKLFRDWVEQSGVDASNEEQVLRWFGQKVMWGGVEGSKLCQVFWEFSNICLQGI
jgi:superfamily II DNA helicase RecQ